MNVNKKENEFLLKLILKEPWYTIIVKRRGGLSRWRYPLEDAFLQLQPRFLSGLLVSTFELRMSVILCLLSGLPCVGLSPGRSQRPTDPKCRTFLWLPA